MVFRVKKIVPSGGKVPMQTEKENLIIDQVERRLIHDKRYDQNSIAEAAFPMEFLKLFKLS
jgi:hypothetical protein